MYLVHYSTEPSVRLEVEPKYFGIDDSDETKSKLCDVGLSGNDHFVTCEKNGASTNDYPEDCIWHIFIASPLNIYSMYRLHQTSVHCHPVE